MRQTGIFGIDIPQLSDKPDITVVSDAIDSVEKNASGRIEHLKASASGNNITLTSDVRDKQYTKYYEGLTVMFESPITLNMSGTYTVSIYNLSQQPLKLKTRVVKGDVVMATWTTNDGFKVANIAGGGGSTSKISVTQNAHGFNFTAVTYDSQLAKYVPTDISKGVQCEGIAVSIDENTFDLYMEGFVDVDVDVRDDKNEGFVSDEYYFASETVAGKMQKDKPTTIVQPLIYAIRLENSLKFYINVSQPHDIRHTLLTQENMESYGFTSIPRTEKNELEISKISRILDEIRKETEYILISNSGNFNIRFIKIGKIVTVYIVTTGGTIDSELNGKILPEAFRPPHNIFLGFPAINGSPYINIQTTGVLRSQNNGATMHTSTTTTQYNLTQSYIANAY